MKRYQVVTWSCDIGSDEHMDYSDFSDAYMAARKYLGAEEYAAVYDSKEKVAYVVFGDPATDVFISIVRVISLY